jgi:hypothetical protein
MKRTGIALLAFCLISPRVPAADLGTWGDLWPVQEQDMLTLLLSVSRRYKSRGNGTRKWRLSKDE